MRRPDPAIWAAIVAQILSWAAFLLLLLWPNYYQGVSFIVGSDGELIRGPQVSSSLVAVNGTWIVLVLLIPVAITALLFLVVKSNRRGKMVSVSAWLLTAGLLFFCALGAFSVGPIYLPAASAAVVASTLALRRRA